MKVAVGSDHRGYETKQQICSVVEQLGHEVVDFGAQNSEPMDYPDVAYRVSRAVAKGQADMGVLACGTGIGMCMVANKIKGVRAALCHDELSAQISRQHNDANVLCLSGDLIGDILLRKIVEVWLSTGFSGGRHQRRVRKIQAIEEGKKPDEIKNGGNANDTMFEL